MGRETIGRRLSSTTVLLTHSALRLAGRARRHGEGTRMRGSKVMHGRRKNRKHACQPAMLPFLAGLIAWAHQGNAPAGGAHSCAHLRLHPLPRHILLACRGTEIASIAKCHASVTATAGFAAVLPFQPSKPAPPTVGGVQQLVAQQAQLAQLGHQLHHIALAQPNLKWRRGACAVCSVPPSALAVAARRQTSGRDRGSCSTHRQPTLLFFCCAASSPLSRSSSDRSIATRGLVQACKPGAAGQQLSCSGGAAAAATGRAGWAARRVAVDDRASPTCARPCSARGGRTSAAARSLGATRTPWREPGAAADSHATDLTRTHHRSARMASPQPPTPAAPCGVPPCRSIGPAEAVQPVQASPDSIVGNRPSCPMLVARSLLHTCTRQPTPRHETQLAAARTSAKAREGPSGVYCSM